MNTEKSIEKKGKPKEPTVKVSVDIPLAMVERIVACGKTRGLNRANTIRYLLLRALRAAK